MIEFPVLGIDTSRAACSKCVWLEDANSAPTLRDVHDTEANLVPTIKELCAQRPASLVWISGPGSYTGLRIGWCVVRTVSFAWGCPIWSVSSIDCLNDAGDLQHRLSGWNCVDGPAYESSM